MGPFQSFRRPKPKRKACVLMRLTYLPASLSISGGVVALISHGHLHVRPSHLILEPSTESCARLVLLLLLSLLFFFYLEEVDVVLES